MAVISFATSHVPHTHLLFVIHITTQTHTHTTNTHMTFIVGGARAVISFAMRSGRPLYMVVPDHMPYRV